MSAGSNISWHCPLTKIVAQRTPDNMFNKYTAEKQQQLAQSGR